MNDFFFSETSVFCPHLKLSNNDLYFEGWWWFAIYRLGKKEPKKELPRNGVSHIPPVLRVLTGYNPALSMEEDELTLQCLIGWRGRIAGNTARRMTKGVDEKWSKPNRIHFTQLSQQHYKFYMIHWPYIEVKANSHFFMTVCLQSAVSEQKK